MRDAEGVYDYKEKKVLDPAISGTLYLIQLLRENAR